ncbi:glycosyltransferase 87 family protein [Gemmatimonadota bacterium]
MQHPLQQIVNGEWNIFENYLEVYTPFFRTPTYPPLYYGLTALFRLPINFLSSTLPGWMDHCWAVYRQVDPGLSIADYCRDVETFDIFRNLFLIKIHYLVFDLVIIWILLKMNLDRRSRLWLLALWMLNPVVLHSTYAHGQSDLMPTVFCVAAFYLLQTRHSGPAMMLLSLGALIKIYPGFLLLPALILVGQDRKKFFKLLLWAAAPFLLFLLPLAAITGGKALQFLHHNEIDRRVLVSGIVPRLQQMFFFGGLLVLSMAAFYKRKDFRRDSLETLTLFFVATLLVLYLSTPPEFRYFTWITPFALLLAVRDRQVRWLFILQFLSLAALRILPQKSIQLAILYPSLPDFFMSIPNMDSVLSTIMDTTILYKACYRLFMLACLAMLTRTVFLLWGWSTWPTWVSRSAAAVSAVLALVLGAVTVTGFFSYRSEVASESYRLFSQSREEQLEMSVIKRIDDRMVLEGGFTTNREGLYYVGELRSSERNITSNISQRAEIFLRGERLASGKLPMVFEPIKSKRGDNVKLKLELDRTEFPDKQSISYSVRTSYTWPYSFSDSLRLFFERWTHDRVFFYFHLGSLLVLALMAAVNLARALKRA